MKILTCTFSSKRLTINGINLIAAFSLNDVPGMPKQKPETILQTEQILQKLSLRTKSEN